MKIFSMSGSLRENVGKKEAKKNRREGLVPCVLYGGEKQVHFTVSAKELDKVLFTPEVHLFEITIDGTMHKAILSDIQYHPITDNALHVDFIECFDDKKVKIALPVKYTGTSKGVVKGGKLRQRMRKITVQGFMQDLPEYITLDITELEIGQAFRVRDIQIDKLDILDPASALVLGVKSARGAAADEEEGEGEEGTEEESSEE